MNSKNIKKHLSAKVRDWVESVTDDEVKKVIKNNVIITGGAIVSLLTREEPHDYDIYFRDKDSCVKVSEYYVDLWNSTHPDKNQALLKIEEDGRVKVFIQSEGVAEDDSTEDSTFDDIEQDESIEDEQSVENDKKKYRPVFLSSNAITLSDKVQIVTRFYGEVEEIHKNYDFAHCTCAWSSWNNELNLPVKALECIINKELYYIGSKYPLCSIIRTRKYIERGYTINAGQYVKMAMQLNDLNLNDIATLEDQLTGVDSGYFGMMIDAMKSKRQEAGEQAVDRSYVFELINRMF